MWGKQRLRLFSVIAIYALGALGAAILRPPKYPQILPLRAKMLDVLTSWPLFAAWLPFGTLYYLEGLGGWILGGMAPVGLVLLAIQIVRAQSRVALILGYGAFIVLIAVLARGCVYAKIP